jgi:hypothetical protein
MNEMENEVVEMGNSGHESVTSSGRSLSPVEDIPANSCGGFRFDSQFFFGDESGLKTEFHQYPRCWFRWFGFYP